MEGFWPPNGGPWGPLAGKIEVWGAMRPSFYLLWRAGGLQPPNWGPASPMAGKIVGQKDSYEKIRCYHPLKRAHTKIDKKAKLFIIKIEGLFGKYIMCLRYSLGVKMTI